MADIPISVGDLFQGGRVQAIDTSIGQTYLRYASELTTDTYVFSFPSAAGSALTFGIPRAIFIDNAENNYSLTVVVSGTQQTFPVPANSSGVYGIDAQQSSSISITSDGASGAGNPVEFIFYNYDKVPFVWYKFGVTNVTVNIPDGADVALGETTDAPVVNPALAGTLIAFTKGILSTLLSGLKSFVFRAGNQLTATSGNVANAIATATLAAGVGVSTYITGFTVSGGGATAGGVVTVTVTDGTWTKHYTFAFPTGAAVGATPLNVQFSAPLKGSAANTAIAVSCPASGAGGTNLTVTAEGFQL
jgi:hypothetical protein